LVKLAAGLEKKRYGKGEMTGKKGKKKGKTLINLACRTARKERQGGEKKRHQPINRKRGARRSEKGALGEKKLVARSPIKNLNSYQVRDMLQNAQGRRERKGCKC